MLVNNYGLLGAISHQNKSVDVSHIIPDDMLKKHRDNGGSTMFHLPECVFKPDQWTAAFQHGLHSFGVNYSFKDKVVVELGTGSGINLVLVKSVFGPSHIYGSDIHPDVANVAKGNVEYNLPFHKQRNVTIVKGGHNLGKWMSNSFRSDIIFGCLPQVVAPPSVTDLTSQDEDSSSHYYRREDYPLASSESHKWGLGLNYHALKELSPHLKSGGQIILNLGGRPGKDRLLQMFHENGFEADILHSERVQQHNGTSISTLVQQENACTFGEKFEFFTKDNKQISATSADLLRKSGGEIFHKIYVIVGTKK